jgi:hypothetical protein
MFAARRGSGDVESVDFNLAADGAQVIGRFARQGRSADAITPGDQFFGQPRAGKTAYAGDVGFNFLPLPAV